MRVSAVAKRERDHAALEQGWRILRTSGNRTLRLARSLADAGFEVWTPIAVHLRSRPRTSVKVEREVAMMPSFVFVRATQIGEIIDAAHDPRRPHPPFSIYSVTGSAGIVPEHKLAPVRAAEAVEGEKYAKLKSAQARIEAMTAAAAEREGRRRPFNEGQTVAIKSPAFAGLSAVVVRGGNRKVRIRLTLFGHLHEVEADTCDLVPQNV